MGASHGRSVVYGFALALAACGPKVTNNTGADADPGGLVPVCTPGDQQACYEGPAGTANVGRCVAGDQTCGGDGQWKPCGNQVTPIGEVCGNSIDDNCNGMADENVDADGDGFTTCGGDCCDSTSDGCATPTLVNAGAFEAAGNMVDDDCDGVVDNAVAANCDSGLASNSADPLDFARALELCQTTTATDNKWGVISARFALPSGSGTPDASQRAIRPVFGGTTVRGGSSFVLLSTGNAAAVGQTNPSYAAFQGGQVKGTTSPMPADWLAANANNLPNAPGCPEPTGGLTARDPVMLELTVRVPTNAKSFKLATNFASSEYPEWTCSPFNDFFVVLLDSTWAGQPANPADKNLATYTSATLQKYPVGVNLAYGNTGLFTVCQNGATGCATSSGAVAGSISTCMSTTELAGTGMDVTNPAPQFANDPGYCGTNNQAGGGTGWLVTQGNVVGGETIKLRIAVWDTSDGFYDSISIIDNFQWSVEVSEPGTVIF
jgi:hypothetical protein